jgi:hypothetical protein
MTNIRRAVFPLCGDLNGLESTPKATLSTKKQAASRVASPVVPQMHIATWLSHPSRADHPRQKSAPNTGLTRYGLNNPRLPSELYGLLRFKLSYLISTYQRRILSIQPFGDGHSQQFQLFGHKIDPTRIRRLADRNT